MRSKLSQVTLILALTVVFLGCGNKMQIDLQESEDGSLFSDKKVVVAKSSNGELTDEIYAAIYVYKMYGTTSQGDKEIQQELDKLDPDKTGKIGFDAALKATENLLSRVEEMVSEKCVFYGVKKKKFDDFDEMISRDAKTSQEGKDRLDKIEGLIVDLTLAQHVGD